MKARLFGATALVLSIAVFTPAAGAGTGDHGHQRDQSAQAGDAARSDGEIKKVDKDAGKLTIKHGPLANLDMPAMTMVFRVKDPAMLEAVKTGDKVKFTADKVGGAYTVTEIEVQK